MAVGLAAVEDKSSGGFGHLTAAIDWPLWRSNLAVIQARVKLILS